MQFDQARCFKGYARVCLDVLEFKEAASAGHRPVSEKNVARLVRIFQIEGCQRANLQNFIKVTVSQDDLTSAQSIAPDSVLQHIPARWEDVALFPISSARGFTGLHRTLAAAQYLAPNDKWWVVELYLQDFAPKTCGAIAEQYVNEQAYDDGYIFHKIRLYHLRGHEDEENRWWARLSKTKQKDLRQLLKNPHYRSVFDSLLPWPGLWQSVKLGSLHRLLTMKCDEEMLRYLRHVGKSWASLFNGIPSAGADAFVDAHSVQLIETLAPGHSLEDAQLARTLISEGKLFPQLTQNSDRSTVLGNILAFPTMIPSLFTFFESLKYLEPCAKIMRTLFPEKQRMSIYEAFSRSYFRPGDLTIEYGHRDDRSHPLGTFQTDKSLAYLQLWLYAMRNFCSMTDFTPRKEITAAKPSVLEPNPFLWHRFGKLAMSLGLNTAQARSLSERDVETFLTSQILQRCRESLGELDEASVKCVANSIRNLQRSRVPRPIPAPQFGADSSLPIARRCGRPFEDDHRRDKDWLFLPHMFLSPQGISAGLSSFYYKWDTFRCFMGDFMVPDITFEAAASRDSDDIGLDDASQPVNNDQNVSVNGLKARIQELNNRLLAAESRAAEVERQCEERLRHSTTTDNQLLDEFRSRNTELQEEIASLSKQLEFAKRDAFEARAELSQSQRDTQRKRAKMQKEIHELTQALEANSRSSQAPFHAPDDRFDQEGRSVKDVIAEIVDPRSVGDYKLFAFTALEREILLLRIVNARSQVRDLIVDKLQAPAILKSTGDGVTNHGFYLYIGSGQRRRKFAQSPEPDIIYESWEQQKMLWLVQETLLDPSTSDRSRSSPSWAELDKLMEMGYMFTDDGLCKTRSSSRVRARKKTTKQRAESSQRRSRSKSTAQDAEEDMEL